MVADVQVAAVVLVLISLIIIISAQLDGKDAGPHSGLGLAVIAIILIQVSHAHHLFCVMTTDASWILSQSDQWL
jgi:hypothetical protein